MKWSGKCEQCFEWNSLIEESNSKPSGPLSKSKGQTINFETLNSDIIEYPRLKTNIEEMDRVIGGGFVFRVCNSYWGRSWHWKIDSFITIAG